MKSFPIELTRELRRYTHSIKHLVKIELAHTLRWCDGNVNVYYNSAWWDAKGITFDAVTYDALPSVDSLKLDIDDASGKLGQTFLGEETRGKDAYVYGVALNRYGTVIYGTMLFYGFCDAVNIERGKVSLELANHLIRWKTATPRRTHTPTCWWTFRDTGTCTYVPTGATITTVKVQWNATDTTGDVTTSAAMDLVDTKISMVLDDGSIHWSELVNIVDADTIEIADGIPAGRHANVGAEVQTYSWCDHSYESCDRMGNTLNFGGFKWLIYLQDKEFTWGRNPNKKP
jgi:hypothetical protein